MPFDPTLPLHGSEITSAELRNQFTGLKALIDAVPVPPVPNIATVLAAGNDATGQDVDNLGIVTVHQLVATSEVRADTLTVGTLLDANFRRGRRFANPIDDDDADTQGARNTAIAAAASYAPANPGHWAGPPPATWAEALDRLAAAISNNGANPIP